MTAGIQFVLGVATAIFIVFGLLYFGVIPGLYDGTRVGPTPVLEALSPDGRYIARSERMKNDHRDWCEERTSIDPVGHRSDWEHDHVFNNQCGMPVEFRWKDNKTLLIRYAFDSAGKARVYRKAMSNDGQVSIIYELNGES